MKALILSCGTGGGHDSAAKAILEQLQTMGHEATLLNPYTLHSDGLARRINNLYILMVQHTPHLFGAVYTAGELCRNLPWRSPVYFANRLMAPIMEKYLADNPCDVAIMTHLYPAEILTNMKNSAKKIPSTIFVSTDYVCVPFTEETRLDAYIIPAEDLAPDYVRCGLPPEKLHPFGIPTKRAFAGAMGKAEARARLRLDPQKKYILITGGSMGGGAIKETMDALIRGVRGRRDVALIVVCGSNKELYDNLVSQRPENTVVVGYTDDMAAYMKAADIFVTKPGGLSSTEAAVCGIPILHTAGIPGCETCNAQYFEAHGMSMIGRDPEEILTRAMALLFDEQKCAAMASRQRAMADGMAAARICEFAEGLASG